MKREEILAMTAGRELDALVGLKLGIIRQEVAEAYQRDAIGLDADFDKYGIKNKLPHYSTDMSAAWEVVEKYYYSDIRKLNGCNWGAWLGRGDGHSRNVTSGTAPEAICKAALLTVLEESQ